MIRLLCEVAPLAGFAAPGVGRPSQLCFHGPRSPGMGEFEAHCRTMS